MALLKVDKSWQYQEKLKPQVELFLKGKLKIRIALLGQSDSVRGRYAVVQIDYKDYPLNFKEVTAFGPGGIDIKLF